MYEWEGQMRAGYLSFSRANLAESVNEGKFNVEAYKRMIEATETNAEYKTGKGKDVNEIYPLTAEAAAKMLQKLKEAEKAADNPQDEMFQSRLKELKHVAQWSKERHSTFSWWIIVGGVLWALFYGLTTVVLSGPDYEKRQAQVVAWEEAPATYSTLEEAKDAFKRNANVYSSATNYKLFELKKITDAYDKVKGNRERTASTLRYGTLSERDKEIYRHNMEVDSTTMETIKAEFRAAEAQTFDQWRQKALDEISIGIKSEKGKNARLALLVVYFMVISVLYILANRPRGYMLSRQRATARVTGGIRKALFAVISWLGISGARMGWTDPDKIVTVFWSDGSTSSWLKISDLLNSSMLFKIIFYAAALTILMFTSAYLLPILTLIGFFTNVERKKMN